jgi:hypothetical protein
MTRSKWFEVETISIQAAAAIIQDGGHAEALDWSGKLQD